MLHFNHDSKQETNEGHASVSAAGSDAGGAGAAGGADSTGASGTTGAKTPNIPTPPEGYQQAAFASTLPRC